MSVCRAHPPRRRRREPFRRMGRCGRRRQRHPGGGAHRHSGAALGLGHDPPKVRWRGPARPRAHDFRSAGLSPEPVLQPPVTPACAQGRVGFNACSSTHLGYKTSCEASAVAAGHCRHGRVGGCRRGRGAQPPYDRFAERHCPLLGWGPPRAHLARSCEAPRARSNPLRADTKGIISGSRLYTLRPYSSGA